MQIDLTALPEDPAALQSMICDVVTATMQRDAQVSELTEENDRLRVLIQKLLRHRFGRRSEQLSPDQLKLAIEDIEQEIAEHDAAEDAAEQSEETRRQRRAARPRRNLGALPAHLPRDEVVIDIDSKECPCCGGALHLIGETRTEMLDIVPVQLRAKVTRRPRYGCRACGETVVQALAPERPIDGGMATEALLLVGMSCVSKFCDFPPYRQSEMHQRQAKTIARSRLSDWVGRTCWWLRPLYDLMVSTVMAAPVVFADDTTLPVLDPGRGKAKTGRLWCYAVDPRTWKGPGHPAAAYMAQTARVSIPPNISWASAASCRSMATRGFPALAKRGTIELVFCWAHCRRHFYDFHAATKSPLAAEALAQIARLYAIEAAASRAPPCRSPAAQPSDRRDVADLAESHAGAHVERLATGGRHPLRHCCGTGPVPRCCSSMTGGWR